MCTLYRSVVVSRAGYGLLFTGSLGAAKPKVASSTASVVVVLRGH